MKIGIDARFYGEAGPGRYTKAIVQHLELVDKENNYIVFLRKEGFDKYSPKSKKFKKVLADYKWYTFSEQIFFLVKVIINRLDLFYVPHFSIPILYPGKFVTAIPDLIMHTYSTEGGTTLNPLYFKFKKLVYTFVFWLAVVRSYRVIVPSEQTMNDFISHFSKVKKSKYVLAHEGVDPDYLVSREKVDPDVVLKRYGIRSPYILYVGSMYAHKNMDRLIDAYILLREKYGFIGQMVLVGKADEFSKSLYKKVREEKLDEFIIFPAFKNGLDVEGVVVGDGSVIALRKKASIYVMPSFKEGFSLTSLEGMGLGLPAVISDIPCHREIYGDSVLYFDPNSSENMAEKINMVLTDESLRNGLIKRGFGQVKKYDWEETAKITLGVFRKALDK